MFLKNVAVRRLGASLEGLNALKWTPVWFKSSASWGGCIYGVDGTSKDLCLLTQPPGHLWQPRRMTFRYVCTRKPSRACVSHIPWISTCFGKQTGSLCKSSLFQILVWLYSGRPSSVVVTVVLLCLRRKHEHKSQSNDDPWKQNHNE